MSKNKAKVPFKIWVILIDAIVLLGGGIFIFGQYKSEIVNLRTEISEALENNPYDLKYSYVDKNDETKIVEIYEYQIEDSDEVLVDILDDVYGENWVSSHKIIGIGLIFSGIIVFIIFLVQYFTAIEGKKFVSLLWTPGMGIVVGLLICCFGISMLRTIGTSRSGAVILIVGMVVIFYAIYVIDIRVSRYMLAKNNPEEYKKMIANEKLQAIAREQAYQDMLDAEKDAAINGTAGAPWETQYLPYPCPYCHRYKVRYIKWEDKRASVYFWGRLSNKIGTNYICDNCKKTWE